MRGGRRNGGTSGRRVLGKDHASRMKEQSYEWRREPFCRPSRCSSGCPVNDMRLEVLQERPRRSLDKWDKSVERSGDYPSLELDHGKEVVYSLQSAKRRHLPQPLPQLAIEGKAFNFPDHCCLSNDVSAQHPKRKLSQPIKGDLCRQNEDALPSSSLGIEWQDVKLKKSSFFDEFSFKNVYSDQPLGSALHSSERLTNRNRFGLKTQHNEMLPDHDWSGDRYDDMRSENDFFKESPFPRAHSLQPRPFSFATSSSLVRDDFTCLHHEKVSDRLQTRIGKYLNDPWENTAYREGPIIDTFHSGQLDQPLTFTSEQHGNRGGDNLKYLAENELYKSTSFVSQEEHVDTIGSNFFDNGRERIGTATISHKGLNKGWYRDQHHYLQQDVVPGRHETSRTCMGFVSSSGDVLSGIGLDSSNGHGNIAIGVEYDLFESNTPPLPYKEGSRYRNSSLSDNDICMHRWGMSPTYAGSCMGDFSYHGEEGMAYRDHIGRASNEIDLRSKYLDDQNDSVRRPSPHWNEKCSNEELLWLCPSKRARSKRSYRTSSNRITKADTWMDSSGGTPLYAENDHCITLQKRLKCGYGHIQVSSSLEGKQDLLRAYKHCKRYTHDKLHAQDSKFNEKGSHLIKNDPPEGSEEFKNKVHKAFLQYSKLLNMSPRRQNIIQGQEKAKKLHCFVCGSQSKNFIDTHSLVTHTYYSLKVGLRTEHLGLHKALCVLMDWNWLVAPVSAKAYQSKLFSEARILREDLILWPPLVLIHNVYKNKSNVKEFMVTVEGLKKILKDVGIDTAKVRVFQGNSTSENVFVVKFMATFSGLQEAEKLQKYYADNQHGKQELKQTTSTEHGFQNQVETKSQELHDFLYAYLALAEDLDELDAETKKRSLVKSKKDIEAIADAPLRIDKD